MASPAHSSSSSNSGVSSMLDDPVPAPLAVIQTVNIRSHIPILLDLVEPNYSQWRCLFDTVLGKFGLDGLIKSSTPIEQRTAEWRQLDCYVVNWFYTTVNKSVFDIIYKARTSAFSF
ncbi:unnamed protein product [Urochloa humidicola]